MTDKTVRLVIQDKRVRKGIIRCLTFLQVDFSDTHGSVCITDVAAVHCECLCMPTLMVSNVLTADSVHSILLPLRFATLRKRIQKFLTDYSI